MSADSSTRSAPGRPFRPGRSGNPGGRPKAQPGFTVRARELSLDVLENMARIATKGRGLSAVRAGELVLAYAEGKPLERVDVTARRGEGLVGGDPDAARARLERLIAGELTAGTLPEGSATVHQTVAHGATQSETLNAGAVLDVTAEPAPADRGQVVAKEHLDGGAEVLP